jgi:pimeloyl-ACP methyl ester carboxylesterase
MKEIPMTHYKTIKIDDLILFYREAGASYAQDIVLLHGFPSSSHQYRNLISALSHKFHLIAPDYPGFGNSDSPDIENFEYSFDKLAEVMERLMQNLGVERFSLYMTDYGVPVGLRIAAKHPDWIQSLIIQNGIAHEEGFTEAWAPIRAFWKDWNEATEAEVRKLFTLDFTKFQYAQGAEHLECISPDAWNMDQYFLDRPGNNAIQLKLFHDYQHNIEHYEEWQAYFREYQPPTLVAWGKNDPFFGPQGALAYQRDLKNIEVHLLNSGHLALEEDSDLIAKLIIHFLADRGEDDIV